ncbi:MAG: hypothetical protein ACTSYI_13730 [Promethearchaeota archaeon]
MKGSSHYNRRVAENMIVQNTRLIQKRKFPKVIRCIATGKCNQSSIITVGSQDKRLYILNSKFEEQQILEFPSWVRCVAAGDLTGDGNAEIVTGSGDQSFRIFKFFPATENQENQEDDLNDQENLENQDNSGEYKEIYYIEFDHFVNSCVIADINGNGRQEIVTGSWDQTINTFELHEDRLTLLWSKKFEKRITMLKVADTNWNGKKEIIALFKGGGMTVIQSEGLEELWSFETEKDLLACDIGAIEVSGLPIIVVGGNDHVLYFFDCDGKLVNQKSMEDRITSLMINDLDGDGNPELIVSEGALSLNVFKFYGPDLFSMDLKWKKRINHVVNDILLDDVNKDNKLDLIYGGYSGTLTAIQDFFYGESEPCFIRQVPPVRVPAVVLEEVSIITPAIETSISQAVAIETGTGTTKIANSVPVIGAFSPKYSRIYTGRYDRLYSGKSMRNKIYQGGYIRKKLKQPYPTPYYRNLAKKISISSKRSPSTTSRASKSLSKKIKK